VLPSPLRRRRAIHDVESNQPIDVALKIVLRNTPDLVDENVE